MQQKNCNLTVLSISIIYLLYPTFLEKMQRITRILSKRSFSTAKPDDFTTILTSLSKSPTPLLFRKACYSLSSPSHITQLIQLIKDTPKGLYNPYRDSQILIQSILSTNQHGENDDFLINKVFNSRYFIKDAGLSAKELEIMVNRTAKKCLDNPTDECIKINFMLY